MDTGIRITDTDVLGYGSLNGAGAIGVLQDCVNHLRLKHHVTYTDFLAGCLVDASVVYNNHLLDLNVFFRRSVPL